MQIDELINKIKNVPKFLNLKKVIENNQYHYNQSVYDHILEVLERAVNFSSGDFIENEEAKRLFIEFTNQEIGELKIKDSMLLTALLHDVSKSAKYNDGDGKEQAVLKTDSNGKTEGQMHEYVSSLLAPQFLEDRGLSEEAVNHVCKVIKLHDAFDEDYFKMVLDWPIEQIVDNVKLRAEGVYIEALFNIYCDCFTAKPFQFALKTIEKIFESPFLYSKRAFYF